MKHKVICIGAVLIDELFYCIEPVISASSNPATMNRNAGGVMRNIAHHLALLDIPVVFITVAGNDPDGEWLLNNCIQAGIDMPQPLLPNAAQENMQPFYILADRYTLLQL